MSQEIKIQNPDMANYKEYDRIETYATYQPWHVDKDFMQLAYHSYETTTVDLARRYELWSLIQQTAHLDKGALIEIGVWRGVTGALIAHRAQQCSIQDNVYLCDTFTGIPKANNVDDQHLNGEFSDTSFEIVKKFIYDYNGLNHVKILQGIFPDDTASEIKDKYFRFAHIDVDVYQSAKDIYHWLWDKMVIGGIMVYDDYGFHTCQGIKKFINEQMNDKDKHIIYNLNGHAIVIKIA